MAAVSDSLTISKLVKCLAESPIRSNEARRPPPKKRVSEYQKAFIAWPWQPTRQSYKPEPTKTPHGKVQSMQRKTTYTIDYAYHAAPKQFRPKKHKDSLKTSHKPLQKISTYNMEFYAKVPEFVKAVEVLRPKTVPQTQRPQSDPRFETESMYTASYPAYDNKAMQESKPPIIIAKDNLDVPASGDIEKNPKSTIQDDFIYHEGATPRQSKKPPNIVVATGEPMEKETEYKGCYIDPVKHSHLAKVKAVEEKPKKFDIMISTAMADFTAPGKPTQRNPRIQPGAIQFKIAPFDGRTTFKMAYKEWPVMPPEVPKWAKKPVYKRPSGGFITRSLYTKDFCDPHVVERVAEIPPKNRDPDIITNKDDVDKKFKHASTYSIDYQPWEGVKAPAGFHIVEKYKPPVEPMSTETVQKADYKGEQTEKLAPIRHISEHRDVFNTADMTFVTTYNENYRHFRPRSCPVMMDNTQQDKTSQPTTPTNNVPAPPPSTPIRKCSPIPKPDLSVIPKVNVYPMVAPPETPEPSPPSTPKPEKTSRTPRATSVKEGCEKRRAKPTSREKCIKAK